MTDLSFGFFKTIAIVRIQAGIFSNNQASMRVLEKCGFLREAVHCEAITKGGQLLDEVLYVRFRDREDVDPAAGQSRFE
jgi:RimJ/RimL family protein N-acetyltransferase